MGSLVGLFSFVFSFQAMAIVGGFDTSSSSMTDAHRKMMFHTVVLLNTTNHNQGLHSRCTGTVLSRKVVLTAAHCIPPDLKNLWVVPSIYEFAVMARMPVIEVIKTRPADLPTSVDFDLALVRFQGTLPPDYKPTSYVTSFPVQPSAFFLDVTGYGETSSGAGDSGELRMGLALIYNYDPNGPEFRADQTNGMGICQGDSGGPAFLQINGTYYVLGVVSAIYKMNRQGLSVADRCKGLSSFSSTVYFRDWIAAGLLKLNSAL